MLHQYAISIFIAAVFGFIGLFLYSPKFRRFSMKQAIHLVLLFSAILSLHAEPAGVVFKNPTFGFTIKYPGSWNVLRTEEPIANLKKTRLKTEELTRLLAERATIPFFSIIKHPEPFEDANPSIRINARLYGKLNGTGLREIAELLIPQFEKMFQNFEMTTKPSDVTLAGYPAVYMKIHYTLEIQDGRSFAVCSEMWLIDRGEYFFIIGAGTRQDEKTGSRAEIREILSTISLDPRVGR